MWTLTLEGIATKYFYSHIEVYLQIYCENLSQIPLKLPSMPYKLLLRNHNLQNI